MERIKLQGEITSPINPDKGCRFAKRCVYAKDICRQQEPALKEVGEGHFFACHLAEELGFVEKQEIVKLAGFKIKIERGIVVEKIPDTIPLNFL